MITINCDCPLKIENISDCRAIAKFKHQKNDEAYFEAKAGPGKKSLAFFEEINTLKMQMQLKPEKTAMILIFLIFYVPK
jgi:hypothetical protein